MEIQITTESEPRMGASEGKPVSSRSPFGRGRVSSPATALSARGFEAVQGSESETNLTYFDCHGLSCQLERGDDNLWQCQKTGRKLLDKNFCLYWHSWI